MRMEGILVVDGRYPVSSIQYQAEQAESEPKECWELDPNKCAKSYMTGVDLRVLWETLHGVSCVRTCCLPKLLHPESCSSVARCFPRIGVMCFGILQ